jgi:hypothetical protein
MRQKRRITTRTLFEMLAFFTAGVVLLGAGDVLFFQRAIDAFRPTVTLPARVVMVGEETVETRHSKHGDQGATFEHRVRPQVTYRFELDGRPYMSSRYFLHESPVLADLPQDRHKRGSVSLRMAPDAVVGRQLQVHVVKDAPELSYVDKGWDGLLHNIAYWLEVWLAFAAFSLVGWLMLLGWQKLISKQNGSNHG